MDSRAAEIKKRAKVLIHELSGPGVLLNSRFHDYNQQHFQTIRQENYRNDCNLSLFLIPHYHTYSSTHITYNILHTVGRFRVCFTE